MASSPITGVRSAITRPVLNFGPRMASSGCVILELHLPFTATLTIHFPGEARLVIMNAASPVSSRVTRMFAPIARNFDLHVPVEEVHAFNLRVFEEDRLMVETQRPERLPLDLTLEAHIPADRSSIAYRRSLKKMGFGEFFLV
ncbi:Uncharacterised protein [Raoultella planticola]|uniref:Vanillate O-demethylase oxygenase-like C-terminal catalytic domain-containing protein n=1 Tax=Raoultella planticola TaxID=575 RepID=A0A485A9V8_RAOPL|nr:Uncharacterised protein [Raoultella planticola]